MIIACSHCHAETDAPLYFYNMRIIKDANLPGDPEDYYACATGKWICPYCGREVVHNFKSLISNADIVALATWKEAKEH